jgi:regulator of sigma E protease
MDILLSFSSGIQQIVIAIIGFTVLMSIVVFVHEFGHFSVARLCGVKVTDFSLGFGKKLFSRQDKHGTIWSLSLIPMGGYVKFFADKSVASNEDIEELEQLSEADKKQTFYFKSIPQKMAIIVAGPLANFLLCLFLLWGINFFLGIVHVKPIIQNIVPDSVASSHGLLAGDTFLTVNGHHVTYAQEVRQEVGASFGKPIHFTVKRDDSVISLAFAPDMIADGKEEVPVIGVVFSNRPEHIQILQYDFIESAKKSYADAVFVARLTRDFFQRLFVGEAHVNELSGPIKIGDAAGSALKTSLESFLLLMALVSMSVGLVNLLPVPMLDGGHLVFYLFEIVGLKASHNFREVAFKIGFVFVAAVMIFTLVNDILTIGAN